MSAPIERSNVPILNRSTVLLVASSYLPNLGGLQSVTAQLASVLQRRGHPVEVLAQRYPRTLPAAEVIDGVRVRRLLFLAPRLRDVRRGRLDLFFAGLFYFPSTLLRLLWRIGRTKPDVVNLHFVGAPAFFLLIAHALLRFRYVVSLHGDDVEGLWRGTWFDRWIFRATLKRADEITACSRYLLERTLEIEPQSGPKARVIHNGMDLPVDLPATLDSRSILSVGRLISSKAFDCLLRAAACCRGQGRSLHFAIIGDGPERSRLETLGRELGVAEDVQFRGEQSHAQVMKAFSEAHIAVIPSRRDSFGLTALEAMASGKPIVATCVGGLPEVLEGADAVLVNPDNPTELAQAILDALNRLEREPDWGLRNREIAAQFTVARMVDKYEAVYAGRPSAEI